MHLQAFHTLYYTDEPVLLGAPTGSGKTVSSELTMLRLFSSAPGRKVCSKWGWAELKVCSDVVRAGTGN
jgi:hypothetical protein